MKRYAIVRVDDNCPFMQEKLDFSSCSKMFNCDKFIRCEKCEHNCRYGDTKEQLIRKVAQVLLREELEWHRENLDIIPKGKIDEPLVRILYEHCLDKAKKIIEFLGVEDDR